MIKLKLPANLHFLTEFHESAYNLESLTSIEVSILDMFRTLMNTYSRYVALGVPTHFEFV